ncbi:MAG: HD domain-containing phosphohydrolase [Lentisphaerota bacterium]
MKFKTKIIFIFLLSAICFCVFSIVLQKIYIDPTYKLIEITEAKQDMVRCVNSVSYEIDNLKSIVSSLSKTETATSFVTNHYKNSDSELINEFINLRIFDFCLLIDSNGKTIYDSTGSKKSQMDSELNNTRSVLTGEALRLMQKNKLEFSNAGLIDTPDGILISAFNALPNTGENSFQLTLIAGKYLTSEIVASMGNNINIPFTVTKFNKNDIGFVDNKELSRQILDNRSIYINEPSNNDAQLTCFTLIPDINKELNFVIKANFSRITYLDASTTLNLYSLAGALFIVLLLVLTAIMTNIFIVNPLAKFTRHTNEIIYAKKLSDRTKFECRKDEIGELAKVFDSLLDKIQKLIESMEETIREKTIEVRTVRDKIILKLSNAIENKYHNSRGHGSHVSKMAYLLAEKLQFPKSKCEIISTAAIVHDIGNIGLPEELLANDGKYNDDEYRTMKNHTVIGASIFSEKDSELMSIAYKIALYHHEHCDGTGYPEGLKGKDIPIEAKITAIVDTFDSLMTDKKYRKSWTKEEVINYLRENSGTFFDEDIVKLFLASLDEFMEIKKNSEILI